MDLKQTREFYPEDIKKQLKLYSIDKNDGAKVIGSLSYKTSNAADVDLFEHIFVNDKPKLIKFFVSNISKMVKKIVERKDNYFLEVKAGLDHLYSDINFGSCTNDVYYVDPFFFELMEYYNKMKFITKKELELLKSIENETTKRQIHYEIVNKILRNYSILRWNLKEIKQGYKQLKNIDGAFYKYTLEDAVVEISNINIEGIFITSERKYSEVSNFFTLKYVDETGAHQYTNLSELAISDPYNFRSENLKTSMYTLMYSHLQPNLFKSIKRMFSYGKAFNNTTLMQTSHGIVNSNLGKFYALISQLKTIVKLITDTKSEYIYRKILYHHLELIRFTIDELVFIDFDFEPLKQTLELAISKLSKMKITDFAVILDEITKSMLNFCNIQTLQILKEVKLYPLPNYLTPIIKPF